MHTTGSSNTHTVLACYISTERAERARAQLQRAGINAEVHETAANKTPANKEDEPPEHTSGTAASIELHGRERDRRKARAVLKAMHLLPDNDSAADTDEIEPQKTVSNTASPNPDGAARSEMPIKRLPNSDPPRLQTSEDMMLDSDEASADGASTSASSTEASSTEVSSSTTLLQRISFWQMMIWGAALLALGTLVLLLFGGQA